MGGSGRCETEGCYREAEFLMTASVDFDGDVLPDGEELERRFCGPCKRVSDWIQAWPPSEVTFHPLVLQSDSVGDAE